MTAFHDMHCHLDFIPNGETIAQEAQADGTLLFANTVSHESWTRASERFADSDNVFIGYGLHPWWVDGPISITAALKALDQHNPLLIGEVGLDFGRRHETTKSLQVEAFNCICHWAAERGGKLLSIHSVHAAKEALDILENSGALESCSCIFHWFTGPSDQLKRAVQMGCYFSFGTRALKTGKGREYVKAIPANKLLLETDYPPERGTPCTYVEMKDQLESVAQAITAIKGNEVAAIMAETSSRLLRRSS